MQPTPDHLKLRVEDVAATGAIFDSMNAADDDRDTTVPPDFEDDQSDAEDYPSDEEAETPNPGSMCNLGESAQALGSQQDIAKEDCDGELQERPARDTEMLDHDHQTFSQIIELPTSQHHIEDPVESELEEQPHLERERSQPEHEDSTQQEVDEHDERVFQENAQRKFQGQTRPEQDSELPVDTTEHAATTYELATSISTAPFVSQDQDGDVTMTEITPAVEPEEASVSTPNLLLMRNMAPPPPRPFGAGTSSYHQYDSMQYNGPAAISEARGSLSSLDLGTSMLGNPRKSCANIQARDLRPSLDLGTSMLSTPRNSAANLATRDKFLKIQRAAKERAAKVKTASRDSGSMARQDTPRWDAAGDVLAKERIDDEDEDLFARTR